MDGPEAPGVTGESGQSIAGIIVAYNTDPDVLVTAAVEILDALDLLIVVDNSDSPSSAAAVRSAAEASGLTYLPMNGNLGIADAQNRAVEFALAGGADYLLFLDDDSGMTADAVRGLSSALADERRSRPTTIAAGPLIIDSRTGESLAFAWRGDAIKHVPLAAMGQKPLEAAFLLSSGCLVVADAFATVGPFRGDYFIDHVDKEWGLRAGKLGFRVVVVPTVVMDHLLADSVEVSPGGIQRHQHGNPVRDYYLTRNSLLLVRDLRLSTRRTLRLLAFTISAIGRKLVNGSSNPARRAYMLRAVGDALRGRRGRLANR